MYKILPCLLCIPLLYAQKTEWQQSLGGAQEEHLYDVISTYDYGYLFAGSSVSEKSGNKANENAGDLDYWLWKMTESGALEWQKNYGGAGNDYLYSVAYTHDGGYILGGASESEADHDKSEASRGKLDYWIVKLNPRGEIEWQRTYGGSDDDAVSDIVQLPDRGFLVAGTSASPTDHDKTAMHFGNQDFWVIRLDTQGQMLWQKSFGAPLKEEMVALEAQDENHYWLLGRTNSFGGRSQAWMLLLDLDGKVHKQHNYGATGDVVPAGLGINPDGQLVLAGAVTDTLGVESDYFVAVADSLGGFEKTTFDLSHRDTAVGFVPTGKGSFVMGGYSADKNTQQADYVLVHVDGHGQKVWDKQLGGSGNDRLRRTLLTRDGGLLVAGTSDSEADGDKTVTGAGFTDYWLVKLGGLAFARSEASDPDDPFLGPPEERPISAFPVPAARFLNVVVPFDFAHATVGIYNLNGQTVYGATLERRTHIVDMQGWAKGVYVVRIAADGKNMERKIVKDE